MANSAGFLEESIWRDPDFRALPRTAQTMYAQLVSQKDIDRAGIVPLQVTKWAKGCNEMTEDDVWRDLKTLEERRFAFVDTDTDEALVRSYMRRTNVVKQPNLMKNALKCAGMAASPKLRHELALELRRLRRADAAKVADEIDSDEPFANPSETMAEPFANPFGGLNPSGTHPEPRGEGEGVGEGISSPLVELREGARANSNGAESANTPPSQNCSKHPNGTVTPCRACGAARLAREAWDADAVTRRRAAHRAVIDACEWCDGGGLRVEPSELRDYDWPAVRCDHTPWSTDEWGNHFPEVMTDA